MSQILIRCFIIIIAVFLFNHVSAQLKEYGLNHSISHSLTQRTEDVTLTLPVWEDFFDSPFGPPSDSLWQPGSDALVNDHFAYLPPTAGVVTFDGLRADGSPYDSESESAGLTDRLESNIIDISQYTVEDSLYLSFFYQFGGYGEQPDIDDGDQLSIEFRLSNQNWQQVFIVIPDNDVDPRAFYQVLIPVSQEDFFHDQFQFAIQASGKQSGPFDVWNVDYIYLNHSRTRNDVFYPDRAVVNDLSSIFFPYTAIPRTHLNFDENFQAPYYSLRTLFNTFQTYRHAVTITVFAGDTTSVFYPLNDQGTKSPINVGEIDTIDLNFDLTPSGLPDIDSTVTRIDYTIGVQTFDNNPGNTPPSGGNYLPIYEPIDFRTNDTIRQTYIIGDYYAYDDGTAESSAGLEVSGNKLAYFFDLLNVDSTFIYGIDMNTIFSAQSAIGKTIQLHVWEDNDGLPGEELFSQQFTVQGVNSYDSLARYTFNEPVLVRGPFHIGFTLSSGGRMPVGLDKNHNTANLIHDNVDGFWEPIGDRLTGSLLLRPWVGPVPNDPVLSLMPSTESIHIYPNPTRDGQIFIRGDYEFLHIYDSSGREIDYQIISGATEDSLVIVKKGLFFVKVTMTNNNQVVKKIIVQ